MTKIYIGKALSYFILQNVWNWKSLKFERRKFFGCVFGLICLPLLFAVLHEFLVGPTAECITMFTTGALDGYASRICSFFGKDSVPSGWVFG